ncbi:MAG: hypothetical protein H6686_02475 [Fibrobacteria bacterium]|nr:hypothetical protein [Fibrobacteria bacterium]
MNSSLHRRPSSRKDLSADLLRALGLAALLPALGWSSSGEGSPNDPNLSYFGRWDRTNPSAPHSHWGGAYVRTRFTGCGISAKFGKASNVVVLIDSRPPVTLQAVPGTVLLAAGLSEGEHSILLAARDPSDELVFQGFVLDAGASTREPVRSRGLVEFIGGSIVSGTGTRKGVVSAYPWMVSSRLQCDRTVISYPRITLADGYYYRKSGDPTVGMEVQHGKLSTPPKYPATFAESGVDWDFRQYTPDLVVVNIGSDDGGTNVPNAKFQASLQVLLKSVRFRYPRAEVFVLGTFAGYFALETQAGVAELVRSGDRKVHFIDTKGWLSPSDLTERAFLTDVGHAKVAAKLTPLLQPYLPGSGSPAERGAMALSDAPTEGATNSAGSGRPDSP